jgi:hypothetical protein
MNKYLSIETGDGTELIPVGQGLYPNLTGGLEITLTSVDSTVNFVITLTGTILSVRDSINDALVQAAQTNWRVPVSVVQIPGGSAITSIATGVTT